MPLSTPLGQTADLGDLPRFSPWPERLLGAAPWTAKTKTRDEVEREFEAEGWGPMLERARACRPPATVNDANQWRYPPERQTMICLDGTFRVTDAFSAITHYTERVGEVIARHLPAPAVVELGCGYGGVILNLARQPAFAGTRLIGAEWTRSGRELTALLAANDGKAVETGFCDITAAPVTDFDIPEGSVVFTSSVLLYVATLRPESLMALARRKPRAVIHFETFHEEYGRPHLWDLMVRRYLEANGYNRNALGTLLALEAERKIEIVERRRAMFGLHPLLPLSLLVWRPGRTA